MTENPAKSETLGWIRAIGTVWTRTDLPRRSIFSECDGMEVDLLVVARPKDNPNRREVLSHRIAERREAFEDYGQQVQLNHEIKIVVVPGDFSQQCINAPATVYPYLQALSLECCNDI
jgi:hypothetical protein